MKEYTTQQVGDILGFKPRTIRKWLKQGKLTGVKVSYHKWLISEASLMQYLTKLNNLDKQA